MSAETESTKGLSDSRKPMSSSWVYNLETFSFPWLVLYQKLSFAFQARIVKPCWLPVPQTLVRMLLFVKRHQILRVTPACALLAGKVITWGGEGRHRHSALDTTWSGQQTTWNALGFRGLQFWVFCGTGV